MSREPQSAKSGTLCLVNLRPEFKAEISLSPELLNDFILNRQRKITIGRDNHKYLVEKYLQNGGEVNFDLNQGLNTYDPRPLDEGLNHILQYITLISERTGETNLKKVSLLNLFFFAFIFISEILKVIDNADVVCWRGAIIDFASSSYVELETSWKFAVEKFEGVLFFKEIDTDDQNEKIGSQTAEDKKYAYWGHKFETLIFAEKGKVRN